MFSRNGVAPGIFRADADRHTSGRPGLQIRSRNANAPAAAGGHHGGIFDVVDGDDNRRTCGQMGAGAGDGQILLLLDGVDHIIAGNGIYAQTRQFRVDIDIALAGAGITVPVGHGGGKGQIPVAERLKIR